MDYNEKIINDVQEGMRELAKALHELTLTIAAHRGEFNTAFVKLEMTDKYLTEQISLIKVERKESEKKTSDRIFDILKIILPWLLAGVVTFLGLWKQK